MRMNEDNKTVAVDLLVPRIGELAGSQREKRLTACLSASRTWGLMRKSTGGT